MPKRKFAECAGSEGDNRPPGGESDDSNCSSVQTDGSTDVAATASQQGPYTQVRKKVKKSVSFKGVTVYYFTRKQGFTCVPSQGGSTLGMSGQHHQVEQFSLSEYTSVQRRLHHDILLDQHQQGKISLAPEKVALLASDESVSVDLAEDEELAVDDYYFLQPVPTRQRRVLLRQSGIKKIEAVEKDECKDIRSSREVCGCNCKVFCDPDTCICSKAGIKCQVDRLSFPCGCSKDGCGNLQGRIEFNPIRVRTHFLHTLMRLELEKKRERCALGEGHRTCQVRNHARWNGSGVTTTATAVSSHSPPAQDAGPQPAMDLSLYNSNEAGSCRDCQKSDLSDLILRGHESSSPPPPTTPPPPAELDPPAGCLASRGGSFVDEEEAPRSAPGQALPQLLMFSGDEDSEAVNAAQAQAMLAFPKDESSYSESSDCSSEGQVDEHFYQPHYPPAAANSRKFPPHNGHSNGYKLEPISQILNPLRFPGSGYPAEGGPPQPPPAPGGGPWEQHYYTKPSAPLSSPPPTNGYSQYPAGGPPGEDRPQYTELTPQPTSSPAPRAAPATLPPETAGPGDLFSLPTAQTAQPVTSFDPPHQEGRQAPPSTPPPAADTLGAPPTQNFGEIIKESIVETVSA